MKASKSQEGHWIGITVQLSLVYSINRSYSIDKMYLSTRIPRISQITSWEGSAMKITPRCCYTTDPSYLETESMETEKLQIEYTDSSMEGMDRESPQTPSDLADNRCRGEVLTKLISAVAQHAGMSTFSPWRPALVENSIDKTLNYSKAVCPDQPLQIIMWKITVPHDTLIYTGCGSEVDPFAQHHAHPSKIIIHERYQSKSVGGVRICETPVDDETVRDCLKAYGSHNMWTYEGNTVLHQDRKATFTKTRAMPLTCTTMAESLACFALYTPSKMHICKLGDSFLQDQTQQDLRCYEKQVADNGFRLRQWAAVYRDEERVLYSKLSTHAVTCEQLYENKLLWTDELKNDRHVVVTSTLPLQATLQGSTLLDAVKHLCFVQDAFPTEQGRVVIQSQSEIYTEGDSTVAVAYNIRGCAKIQLMVFSII
jgi:hypothetical protein